MPFDRNLDPTSEYTSMGFAVLSNLLLRPLMSYRHVAGDLGNEVVPDLAAAMPDVSPDGLTYRFTIRDGVRFAPPIDREVTSYDVAFALERLATPEAGARYGFYFMTAIEGMSQYSSGEATSISGIKTPDENTIVFHLIQPTGDFLKRLAMPAAAPIPPEIGECFDSPGYGRYLVATGPYMIKGSASIGTSCPELAPASGFVPEEKLILVRNPSYDFATDDPAIRSAAFRRYEMTVEPDVTKIYRRVEAGTVDIAPGAPSLDVIRRYASRPKLRDNLRVESGDRIWYISMNLTQPPFDDIYVRRAANYVMDKDFLVRSWGGALQGEVATHLLPDAMLDGALEDYDPYPSYNYAGDVRRAAAEMKRSKYDTDADGLCDAPACKGVLHVSRPSPPWSEMTGIIQSSLRKIGIELETRPEEDAYEVIQRLPNDIPITSAPGWVKDYPDPYSFIGFLFDGRNIRRPANTNYAMVGFDRSRARELDLPLPEDPVPSVDAKIDRCAATLPTGERNDCWAELDRYIMTEVVPWIPYLEANKLVITSDAVSPYEFDQFSGEISLAHIGIDRSLQR